MLRLPGCRSRGKRPQDYQNVHKGVLTTIVFRQLLRNRNEPLFLATSLIKKSSKQALLLISDEGEALTLFAERIVRENLRLFFDARIYLNGIIRLRVHKSTVSTPGTAVTYFSCHTS